MSSSTALPHAANAAAPVPAATAAPASVDDAVRAVYELAISKLQAGRGFDTVRQDLRDHGLSAEIADRVVANLVDARRDAIKSAKRGQGWKHVGIGAVVAVIGIAITVGTYESAVSSGGGKYTIAWGAMLFGAVEFLWGLVKLGSAGSVSDEDVFKTWQA